jgi:hypothetical protein
MVIIKKRRAKARGAWIIISKNILKFYDDKREKYRLLYSVEKKYQQKKW